MNDGAHSYTYDAEGKISKVDSVTAYTYDGEGQRVKKLVGENVRFVYGIGGQLIAEFDGSTGSLKKEYVYGGATLVTIEPTALNSNGTQYTTSDNLGSPRVITKSGGLVASRHDYLPFGGELGAGTGGRTTGMGFSNSGDTNRKKFTGYERDNETGLDFAQARYYSNTQGRFSSPDPLMASATAADPQTFNRYAYVVSNPLKFVDPSGMIMGQRKDGEVGDISVLEGTQYNRGTLYGFNEQDVAEYEVALEQGVPGGETVSMYAQGDAEGLFRSRARESGNIVEGFATGQELIADLQDISSGAGPIAVVNVFSHGFPPGIIGAASNNTGLYIEYQSNAAYRTPYTFQDGTTSNINVLHYIDLSSGEAKNRSAGAATTRNLADAIGNGSINVARNGQINLFGCFQTNIASHISALLGARGRGDISVTGGSGKVTLTSRRAPIVGTGRIDTYRGGVWQRSSAKWRYR